MIREATAEVELATLTGMLAASWATSEAFKAVMENASKFSSRESGSWEAREATISAKVEAGSLAKTEADCLNDEAVSEICGDIAS